MKNQILTAIYDELCSKGLVNEREYRKLITKIQTGDKRK